VNVVAGSAVPFPVVAAGVNVIIDLCATVPLSEPVAQVEPSGYVHPVCTLELVVTEARPASSVPEMVLPDDVMVPESIVKQPLLRFCDSA
jgi:hypothetical protein